MYWCATVLIITLATWHQTNKLLDIWNKSVNSQEPEDMDLLKKANIELATQVTQLADELKAWKMAVSMRNK